MLRSYKAVYCDGKVEFLEPPDGVTSGRVIVTFLPPSDAVDLTERGISPEQAADLRGRLSAFADDWGQPEMDVYDAL